MSLRAQVFNGVKIYDLQSYAKLPEFISERQRRKLLASDENLRRRIELVQDFKFNTASHCVTFTDDGQYIVAAGSYPPQVKVYDTEDLALKFERHVDSDIIETIPLEDSWRKLALLQDDRFLELHAAHGRHLRTRIPKQGRAMVFNRSSAELIVGSSSSDIYRLSLQSGRFMKPLESESDAVNTLAFCQRTQILLAGGEDGGLEVWDSRSKKVAGRIQVRPDGGDGSDGEFDGSLVGGVAEAAGKGITALEWAPDCVTFATGDSDGRALVFDLRSTKPLLSKTMPNGTPVKKLRFHSDRKLFVADSHAIKIVNSSTGKHYTTFEAKAPINDLKLVQGADGRDTGLVIVAGGYPDMMTYYIPELGAAPKWCGYVDSLTEELEEGYESTEVFDDYKFISKEDIDKLGLSSLVGSPVLRAYMHGYFIDSRLYKKVAASLPSEASSSSSSVSEDIVGRKRKKRPKQASSSAKPSLAPSSGAGESLDSRFLAVDPAFDIDETEAETFHVSRGSTKSDAKRKTKALAKRRRID